MFKRERSRRAGLEASRNRSIDGRPRRAVRPDLESLEYRQLLTSVSEFPLQTATFSNYVAVGSDKNIWFTLFSNNLGRLNPQTGKVDQFLVPTPNSNPEQIINGPDGNLWFLEAAANQFGVVNPTTGAIAEVPILPEKLPATPPTAGNPEIQDITAGPDGNIWFTEVNQNKIGMINPTTHAVQQFAIPTANALPYGITEGPDGNIWFTESNANKVGRINPTTHVMAEYNVPSSSGALIRGITTGPDGNLYFTITGQNGADQIGKINPTSTNVSTFSIPTASAQPLEITGGPDGRIWFTEHAQNKYGALDPASGTIAEYAATHLSLPQGIVTGPDGNLYAGLAAQGAVDKITTAGVATPIDIAPGTNTTPSSIQAASNGNLYFAEANAQLGAYNTTTHLAYPIALPAASLAYHPAQIAVYPTDGSLWFTENGPSALPFKIGRLDPTTGAITDTPGPSNNNVGLQGIAFDAKNGLFYFAESTGNRLGSINPTNHAISETFPTLPNGTSPYGVVADSTGRVWFTESGTGQVGVFDPSAPQSVAQITLPAGSTPQGITLGPDGNIWVVETAGTSRGVAVINPTNSTVINQIAAATANGSITVGPDGAIWFGETAGVGRIDTASFALTTFAATNATPQGVVAGPDGNLYFTGAGTFPNPNVIGAVALAPAATASQLVVTTQPPADVTANQGFGLTVTVNSPLGQADTFYNGPVTIQLGANPGGSTLSGNLTATAVNGVASFPGLSLNNAGAGYTLQVTAQGLPAVTTSPVRVSLPATHLVVITQPPTYAGLGLPFPVVVAAEDASGNIDTSFNGPIRVALGSNSGTLVGANFGVVSLPGVKLTTLGAGNILNLSDPAGVLAATATNAINVVPATSATVNTSIASTIPGRAVTLTATISRPSGTPSGGKVTLLDGSTVLGSATLSATGTFSLTTSALALGTHTITVTYAGDPNDSASTSAPVNVYVGDGSKSDFDGDGKADIAVYGLDPKTGKYDFRILTSSSGFKNTITFDNGGFGFGNAQSIPVPADYFGDGKSAYALWYANGQGGMNFTAISSVTGKSITIANFGGPQDIPVVADVDGDGKADFGVYGFDPHAGWRFTFLLSSKNFDVNQQDFFNNNGFGFGNAQAIPVVADFDGSGKAGFGLYVPSATGSTFYYINPAAGVSFTRTNFGGLNDIPTAIDYDGDGKADLALYGPSSPGHYRYTVLTSSSGYNTAAAVTFDNGGFGYGNSTSIPVVADYEGTGKADFGVYVPDATGGMEFIYQTAQTGGGVVLDFATATDLALTAPTYLIAKKVRG